MQKKITKLGVILRRQTPKEIFLQIQEIFKQEGIDVLIEQSSASMINYTPSFPLEALAKEVDAMCSIGGDGTLLSLIRHLYAKKIPIFGINTGTLGFLTAINPTEVKSFAKEIAQGNYLLQEHMMLEANINHHKFFAINEFLISKNNLSSGILTIQALIDNKSFNNYRADSLIIATPTGSTAYNISAGGSIFYPLCKNILLTPVAAHTLTQRPMVLDHSFILDFKIDTLGVLIIDGQENIPIDFDDTITIKMAENPAILIQKQDRNYFQVLKEKFQWGQK